MLLLRLTQVLCQHRKKFRRTVRSFVAYEGFFPSDCRGPVLTFDDWIAPDRRRLTYIPNLKPQIPQISQI